MSSEKRCRIFNGAITFIDDTAKPEEIEEDWIAQFFNKARFISNEEFQIIWSKLLADECNEPGSVPRGLIFILERMSREEAESFMKLCAITITAYAESAPLLLNLEHDTLDELGLDFDKLIQLESTGLIKLATGPLDPGYALVKESDDENNTVSYFEHGYNLPENMDIFPVSRVLFTKNGASLYKATTATECEGFWNNTVVPWIEKQIEEYKKNPNQ